MKEALVEAICHHVRYETRGEDGESRAERNARFGMSHLTPEDPEIPSVIQHVWLWFWHLSMQRANGLSGPEPFGWIGIRAWAEMTNTLVSPEEVEMLVAMDVAYRSTVSAEQAANRTDKSSQSS